MSVRYLVLTAVTLSVIIPAWSALPSQEAPPSITVVGEAKQRVSPDVLGITIQIETRSQELSAATREVEAKVEKALQYLSNFGLQKDSVKLLSMTSSQRYDERGMGKNVQYYELQQEIIINLSDVSRFSSLQSGLLQLGVATITEIEPRTTKEALVSQQLLSNALSLARAKAATLAAQEGMTITSILNIVEGIPAEMQMRPLSRKSAYGGVGGVDIGLQEIELDATVTATYQMQKKQ